MPAGLVRSLEVLKTLSPEHDANSLGGTVSVNTLSAFDQSGRLLSASVNLYIADRFRLVTTWNQPTSAPVD